MSTWFAAVAAVLALGCGGADTPAETGASGDDEGSTAVDDGRPPYYSTLDRMPVDLNSAGSILGSGWVGAEVGDGILVVEGRFEGLLSPATEAHIHRARPGLRGPPVGPLDLEADEDGTAGAVRGQLSLDASLESALRDGELYVQIHSESNPEGVLRGWLAAS